jgi:transposase-like protein
MLNRAEIGERNTPASRDRRWPAGLPREVRRWTPARKAGVLAALEAGGLGIEVACRAYHLSPEEIAAWKRALDHHGLEGLKIGRLRERPAAAMAPAVTPHAGRRPWRGEGLASWS